MNLILPPTYLSRAQITSPLFFLAGPVAGGDDWQLTAARLIEEKVPQFFVAIPQKYKNGHPLYGHLVATKSPRDFQRQVLWERHYLKIAARLRLTREAFKVPGCLIFWLPAESTISPRTDGKPYAMDTRGEIGEALGWLMHDDSLRIVIGAEESFPGLRTIKGRFQDELGEHFMFYDTLEETVSAGVEIALHQK